jgi:DNA-binding MarR family transcriptional regulator
VPADTSPDIEELAIRLHSAVLHLMRRIRREDDAIGVSATGVSAPQLSALSCVAFGTPRTLGELAHMEQVSPPTMTRIVAALEQQKLVTRTNPAADKRVSHIIATPKGRRMIEQGRDRRAAFLARHLAALPAADRRALSRAADLMLRIYEESR